MELEHGHYPLMRQNKDGRRVSAWFHTVRQWQHDRPQFQILPMPACRHVEENSSAVKLATRRFAGVAPNVNKTAHSGFETQRRCHQNSKKGVSVAQQEDGVDPHHQ